MLPADAGTKDEVGGEDKLGNRVGMVVSVGATLAVSDVGDADANGALVTIVSSTPSSFAMDGTLELDG